MLKKLYKKNGLIIIAEKELDNLNTKMYYSLLNRILKKDFYKNLGYIY